MNTNHHRRMLQLALGLALLGCEIERNPEDQNAGGAASDTAALDPRTLTSGTADGDDGCASADEPTIERALGFDVAMNGRVTGNCLITAANGAPTMPALDYRIEPRSDAYDYFSAQPDAMPVRDLGDRAVWATLNEMTGNLAVVFGDSALVVAVSRADGLDEESQRQAEALARGVLAERSRRAGDAAR